MFLKQNFNQIQKTKKVAFLLLSMACDGLFVSKKLFGGDVKIAINGVGEEIGGEIIDEVCEYGLELEKIFNFFDKKSELSMLNRKRKLKVSRHLFELINFSLRFCELSRGKYDISIGKQIVQRKNSRNVLPVSCSYRDILLSGDVVALENGDVLIDLGSVAKGYIVDKMAEKFLELGILSGVIDARGDIRVFGDFEEAIGIQHPRESEKTVGKIRLKNLSVATSGDYRQFYGDYKNSHILNSQDLISVTVVASSLAEADICATTIFVSGKNEREKLIKENKKIRVLTIDGNLRFKYYNGFEKLVVGFPNHLEKLK